MKTSKQLTPCKKAAALALSSAGSSTRKIARQLGFAQSSISTFIKRANETGNSNRKSGTGEGNRKSTEEEDEVLEHLSLADRFRPANELRKDWKTRTGVEVSKRTVNRHLLLLDLPAMKPKRKPPSMKASVNIG